MSNAFVIQLHSGRGLSHYDLMLEDPPGGALATWQLTEPLARLGEGESVEVQRISDHRREYLTYEGPVSGGRGEVRIDDVGRYEWVRREEDCWCVQLAGRDVAGQFELKRQGDHWRITRLAETGDG